MIIEFFLGLVTWIGELVIGMMPPDQSGEMVTVAADALSGVVSLGSGLSAWIPWAVIGVAGALVGSAYSTLFVVKIIRQLAAHIPQFGGTG